MTQCNGLLPHSGCTPPHPHCSLVRLWIHGDPDQSKWMNNMELILVPFSCSGTMPNKLTIGNISNRIYALKNSLCWVLSWQQQSQYHMVPLYTLDICNTLIIDLSWVGLTTEYTTQSYGRTKDVLELITWGKFHIYTARLEQNHQKTMVRRQT